MKNRKRLEFRGSGNCGETGLGLEDASCTPLRINPL